MRFRVSGQNLRRADGIGHDAKALAGAERFGHAQRGRAGIEEQRIAVLNVRKCLSGNGTLLRGKRVRSGLLHRRLRQLRRRRDRAAGDAHEAVLRRHRIQIRADRRLRRVQERTQLRDCHLSVLRQKLQNSLSADVNFQSACCHSLHVLFPYRAL